MMAFLSRPAKRKALEQGGRTQDGSAFAFCPVCGVSVALRVVNEHLDTACKGYQLSTTHDLPPAPPPPSSDPVPLAAALKWTQDAAPAARKFGQHTGRAAGVLPPPPPDDLPAEAEPFLQPSQSPPRGGVTRTYGLGGHLVLSDVLSESEEAALVVAIYESAPPFRLSRWNGQTWGKSWGVQMDMKNRKTTPAAAPLPAFLAPLCERIRGAHPLLRRFTPNHANAIEYLRDRGDHLSAHVDDRKLSGDLIVNVSLCCDSVMTYARENKGGPRKAVGATDGPGAVRVVLPRRCVQVQSGDSRYGYTHAIGNGDLQGPKRVSITFRESPVTQAAPVAGRRGYF